MTSVFSKQNYLSLCPASFHTPKPRLPVIPGLSWLPAFAFQSYMMKMTFFFMLILEVLVGVDRTIQLQLLWNQLMEHRVGLLWYWMVCLGLKQRSFCHFWDCTQVLNFSLFADYEGHSISSKEFLPTELDLKANWIKFSHSSLI